MALHPNSLPGTVTTSAFFSRKSGAPRSLVVGAEVGQAVVRPVGLDRLDPVEGAQLLEHDVAVVLQRQPEALDRALHAGQRALGRGLRGGPTDEVLLRLDVRHRPRTTRGGDRPADPEAGHAVELRDALHHQYAEDRGDASKLVVVQGVSKMYAMTGFRIGWAIANREVCEAMTNIQSHQTSGPVTVSQWAAIGALSGVQSPIETCG